MSEPKTYRGWSCHYDHPPIPIRSMDWSATSPDYEADCDSEGCWVADGQQVHAATYEALCAEIDAVIAEQTGEIAEIVARLVAPNAWTVFDAEKARMLRKYKGKNIGFPMEDYQHKPSMETARAILDAIGARQFDSARPTLLSAAIRLRECQRAYMADRGNDTLGRAVATAATELDAAIAKATDGAA